MRAISSPGRGTEKASHNKPNGGGCTHPPLKRKQQFITHSNPICLESRTSASSPPGRGTEKASHNKPNGGGSTNPPLKRKQHFLNRRLYLQHAFHTRHTLLNHHPHHSFLFRLFPHLVTVYKQHRHVFFCTHSRFK